MTEIQAFRELIAAANEVSRRGAETGPQWTKLTIALLRAKPATEALATKDAEIARLREALEWYASEEAWTVDQVEGAYGDYGTRARFALSPIPDTAGGMPVEVK